MRVLKISGLAALVLVMVALGLRFLSGPEDYWICQNGNWIKHGNPSSPQPTVACSQIKPIDKSDLIIVDSPKLGDIIRSPLLVKGKARGNWYFEASFPVELIASQGSSITYLGQTVAQAQSEWMTTEFVPFEAIIDFEFPQTILCFAYPCTISGTLVLKKDNPSGLPEFDDSISVPVTISEEPGEKIGSTTAIKIFFNNTSLDPQIFCNKVFPVERLIPKTTAVARAALEELLKGPTTEEKNKGYFTNINLGVKIQKLTIENETAKVDFDETLERAVGGSCRVSAIRSEITETLKQFSTVKEVVISINGRTEDILQP